MVCYVLRNCASKAIVRIYASNSSTPFHHHVELRARGYELVTQPSMHIANSDALLVNVLEDVREDMGVSTDDLEDGEWPEVQ